MKDGMPALATIARGRLTSNLAEWKGWAYTQEPRVMARLGRRLILSGLLGLVVDAAYKATGRKVTATREARHLIRHGFPVAIWTPPGEWRIARTIGQLAVITAAGGEVLAPKDAD